jgi:hypothetical protein
MKPYTKVIVYSFGVACLAGLLSWHFADADGQKTFLSGLLLNLVPEAVGIAAGIVGTLFIASKMASARFSEHAPKVFNLLAQLRSDGAITPDAAQKAMIALVPMMDESIKAPTYKDGYIGGDSQHCRVCGKASEFREGRVRKCNTCGLRAEYWRAEAVEARNGDA